MLETSREYREAVDAGDALHMYAGTGARRYEGMPAIGGTHGWRQGGCGSERARVRIIRYL